MNAFDFSLFTDSGWGTVAAFAIDLLIRVAALLIVPRNRRPITSVAWLMAIFLIPFVGILAFALLGSNKLPAKRRRKQREINEIIMHSTDGAAEIDLQHPGPEWMDTVARMNSELGAVPMIGGNRVIVQGNYEATIKAMAHDIDQAEHQVHLEFYILAYDETTGPVFEALLRAQSRGVKVRVLLDHIASTKIPGFHRHTLPRLRTLAQRGGEWHYMLPVRPWRLQYQRPDLRNHRKLLVIDSRVGYMGSQNLIDSTYNKWNNRRRGLHWYDLMVRVDGPTVLAVEAIFTTDWYQETDELLRGSDDEVVELREALTLPPGPDLVDCQVVPSGPGFDGENNLRLFLALIYSAQRRISITSPYFVPDDAMLYAITSATRRGVAVELFVSEAADQAVVYHAQCSYYEQLLEAGVRIFRYRAPTILHAKHFTIDEEVAVIGSSNMDMRSFTLNLEVSLLVQGATFVEQLRRVQDEYRENSRELTLAEWQQRPLRSTLLDNLARLTSALQ
ncbi:cardiolipin synthase [Micrococcales bacterium 31B]|nr:cardiolipin synthase [Micrococcales bacterium 31B]